MRRFASCLLFLLLAAPLWAQEVALEVKGDTATVQVDRVVVVREDRLLVRSLPFSVQAPAGGFGYQWDVPTGWQVTRKGRTLEVTAAPKGDAKVSVTYSVVDFDKRTTEEKFGQVAFVVGEVSPPTPPDPKPPAPVPVAGMKVLIVYESADLSKMPAAQQSVLYGKTVRERLNSLTGLGPDGKTREWRMYDKDTDASGEAPHWGKLLKRPRVSVPWVVISDGGGNVVHEGALPGTVAEFLGLLDRFAPKALRKAG